MLLPFSSYKPNTALQPHQAVSSSYLFLLSAILFLLFCPGSSIHSIRISTMAQYLQVFKLLFTQIFLKINFIKFIQVILVNKIIQVSNSHFIIHTLQMASCIHHPKSNNLLSPYIWPLYLLLSLNLLSFGNHHIVA